MIITAAHLLMLFCKSVLCHEVYERVFVWIDIVSVLSWNMIFSKPPFTEYDIEVAILVFIFFALYRVDGSELDPQKSLPLILTSFILYSGLYVLKDALRVSVLDIGILVLWVKLLLIRASTLI